MLKSAAMRNPTYGSGGLSTADIKTAMRVIDLTTTYRYGATRYWNDTTRPFEKVTTLYG
jgi:hypothetical protein